MYANVHNGIIASLAMYLILLATLVGTLAMCVFAYRMAGWFGVVITWLAMSVPVTLIACRVIAESSIDRQ
jgi:hypothetical protein